MTFWVIVGFGFLFSMRAIRQRTDEPFAGLSVYGLWRGALDFLVSVLLLVTLYDLAAGWALIAPRFREADVLCVWVAAYLIGKYQKKPDLFFICVAALSFWIVTLYRGWLVQISFAAVTVSWIFIFQAFFQGLKYALRFTKIPEAVKGWPVFCLLAFAIVVALAGVVRLVF